MIKNKNIIWLFFSFFLNLSITKAGNKPFDISIGIHTAYSPYCNINNELNLYYSSQGTPSHLQYILRSKLNVYDVGAFVDLKYFRANLYRTKCISSNGSGSGSQQVFRNNTHTGFYRLYENESLVNEEIYNTDYVSADYQATSGSFLLKYPVKEVFFPYAGLGFSNIRKMDLDGNGVDDYTYGTPSSRLSVYGVDSVGAESGRTKTQAFLSVGAGIIKHLGEFSVELLWGMDFGIDGRKPFTQAYRDYHESRYSSGSQSAELTAKSRGYYRMSIGFTFAYTFSVDTKSKQQVKPASAPAVEAL